MVATGHALLLGLLAWLWVDPLLPYGALALLLLATGCRLYWAGLPLAQALATVGGLGFGLYLLAWLLERVVTGLKPKADSLGVWRKPLSNAALLLTAAGVLGTLPLLGSYPTAAAVALGFAGALCLTIAYLGRYYRLGYLGVALLELAWIVLLVTWQVSEPQGYALPAGLYLVGVGYLERRRGLRRLAVLVESLGLAGLLLTSLIQSLDGASGFPYFLLLLAEALLVVWWGAARRLKIPFFIGLGASVLNVVAQVVVLIRVYEVDRWLIIFGVGLLLVALAVFVERQRARLMAQAQAWREALERWD